MGSTAIKGLLVLAALAALAGGPGWADDATLLVPGRPLPSVALPALDGGKAFAPRRFAGKKLVLHVFGSWSAASRVLVPGWNLVTREAVDEGRVSVAAIVLEQHPERARLFLQWNEIDWPVFVDRYGLLEVTRLPLTLFVDERSVVRRIATRDDPRGQLAEFLSAPPAPRPTARAVRLDVPRSTTGAVRRYERELEREGTPAAHFRLGSAYRARYDNPRRRPGDFARAVEHWSRAHTLRPENSVWRARLAQYAPAAYKPYPFYDWVERARHDLRGVGIDPVELKTPLTRAEQAYPTTRLEAAEPDPGPELGGRASDADGIEVEAVAVTVGLRPGGAVRVLVELRPMGRTRWGEGRPSFRFRAPAGWEGTGERVTAADEGHLRRFELDLRRTTAKEADFHLQGTAEYHVCEGGDCFSTRRAVTVPLPMIPAAAGRSREVP